MKKEFENLARRMLACMMIFTMLVFAGCNNGKTVKEENKSTSTEEEEESSNFMDSLGEPDTINLWYTNDELTSYLKICALTFSRSHDIQVNIELVSSVDYLENINSSTKNGDSVDVYILNTESLEKAYLAGLATENTDSLYNNYSFPQVALDASTYKGRLLGYPLYYDTVFFLYNKDFVREPETFQDIIKFSEGYEGEFPGIETIISFDVYDLFFSYGFVGSYLNLGGVCGDDASIIDVANDKVIEALTFYKKLNQALYFDADDSTYDKVLKDFLDGKVLYTMGSTATLAEIITSGMNYGICTMPRLNAELETKAVSVNYTAVVNPYSPNKELAKSLAKSISYEYAENFYASVKKLPSRRLDVYPNDEWKHIAEQYEHTAILPKLMAATNYWMELEVTLNNIWKKELNEETEVDMGNDSLTEEEQMQLRQQMMEEIMRDYVAGEINEVQEKMELQIR